MQTNTNISVHERNLSVYYPIQEGKSRPISSVVIKSNHPDDHVNSFFQSEKIREEYENRVVYAIFDHSELRQTLERKEIFDVSLDVLTFFFDYVGANDSYLDKDWVNAELEPKLCSISAYISNGIEILKEMDDSDFLPLDVFNVFLGMEKRRYKAGVMLMQEKFYNVPIKELLPMLDQSDACDLVMFKKDAIQNFIDTFGGEIKNGNEAGFTLQIKNICDLRKWLMPSDMSREIEKAKGFISMLENYKDESVAEWLSSRFPCCVLLYAFLYEVLGFDIKNISDLASHIFCAYENNTHPPVKIKLCEYETIYHYQLSEWADVISFHNVEYPQKRINTLSDLIGIDKDSCVCFTDYLTFLKNIDDDVWYSLFDLQELRDTCFNDVDTETGLVMSLWWNGLDGVLCGR